MKKRFVKTMLVSVVALTLTVFMFEGCGDGDDDDEINNSPDGKETPKPDPPTPDPDPDPSPTQKDYRMGYLLDDEDVKHIPRDINTELLDGAAKDKTARRVV